MTGEKRVESLEIFRGASLSNRYFGSGNNFFYSFLVIRTLVISGDTRCEILFSFLAAQPGGVTINNFVKLSGNFYFLKDLWVIIEHPWPIHHFCQVHYFIPIQQLPYFFRGNIRSSSFERGSRHTTWSTKMELQWDGLPIFDHKLHAIHANYIRNLMRIGYSSYRSVRDGPFCKF